MAHLTVTSLAFYQRSHVADIGDSVYDKAAVPKRKRNSSGNGGGAVAVAMAMVVVEWQCLAFKFKMPMPRM
eukprot:scaffold14292_cov60-Attheya_sp.AAC.1